MSKIRYGGCQCGAVRYRANSLRDDSHVCHCRMCQKAVGNFFVALVGVPFEDFEWTRGETAVFRSSQHVERGFCSSCGTPLFFRHDDGAHISMTIASFDHPETIPLTYQYGMEGKLPQVDQLADLADKATTEENDPEDAAAIKRSSRQHPDHETKRWPA